MRGVRRQATVLVAIAIAIIVIGLVFRPTPVAAPSVALPTEPSGLQPVADGPVGSGTFRGVLVQRTTHFETGNTNDSIPDFDRQVYDTDGAWSPEQPDRIVIPEDWDGEPVIFTVRAAWAGHQGRWVELKLYCDAERPIGETQEDKLVAVVQLTPNIDSPFLELNTPPLPVEGGEECFIAFKTPWDDRYLMAYNEATTLFGAYVVGD